MSEQIKRPMVFGVFAGVIAIIWSLGSLKAEMDNPLPAVYPEPAVVQQGVQGIESTSSITPGSHVAARWYDSEQALTG